MQMKNAELFGRKIQMSNVEDWVKRFNIPLDGIIHIGAHLCQESDTYRALGTRKVLWVESDPNLIPEGKMVIEEFQNQSLINETLWSSSTTLDMHYASNGGGSSSIYDFHLHKASYPDISMDRTLKVKTITLDQLFSKYDLKTKDFNFMILDVQGAELEVLKGSKGILQNINFIISEVSTRELYKGAPKFLEVTNWLKIKGFKLVASRIDNTTGWGDALFLRNEIEINRSENGQRDDFQTVNRQISLGTFLRLVLIRLNLPATWLSRGKFFRIFHKK